MFDIIGTDRAKGDRTMKARLLEARPAGRDEAKRCRVLPAGTIVTITGINVMGRMTADCNGWKLNVGQDQAEPIDE